MLYFKRFCAGLLCISLFFSMGLVHKLPVHASDLDPLQTEPQSQLTQESEPEDHGGDEDETVPQEMKP